MLLDHHHHAIATITSSSRHFYIQLPFKKIMITSSTQDLIHDFDLLPLDDLPT